MILQLNSISELNLFQFTRIRWCGQQYDINDDHGSRSIKYSLQFALIIHHTIISPSPHIPIPTEFNFFFESYLIFIILFILVAILSPSQSTSFPARDRKIMRSLNFHTNITCRGFSSRILVYNCLSFAEIKNQNINERTIITLEKQHLHLINTYKYL